MAHSYVDYCKHHIHLRDEHIVWLMATVIHGSVSRQLTPEVAGLLAWWESRWHTFGPGCVELPLDDFLRDSESVGQLIEILTLIESRLHASGPIVTEVEMNKLVRSRRFQFRDQSTASLCDVVNKFRELLELGQSDLR